MHRSALSIAIIFALGLSACGGSDSDENTASQGAQAPASNGAGNDEGNDTNNDADSDPDADDHGDAEEDENDQADDEFTAVDAASLLQFNIAGSTSLHALNESVSISTSAGIGAPRLVSVEEQLRLGLLDEEAVSNATNLLAIDDDGNLSLAADAPWPISIAHTLLDPTGEYIFVAFAGHDHPTIDYSRSIAALDCGIVRVSLSTDEFTCVAPGYEFMPLYTNQWAQTLGGDFKGLRADQAGNIYFSGAPFERECDEDDATDCRMTTRGESTLIYKVAAGTETVEALSTDLSTLLSFNVFDDGTLVHHSIDYETDEGGYQLALYQEGTTYALDGTWRAQFYVSDDEATVIYGYPQDHSIQYARIDEDQRLQVTSMSMDLFAGEEAYSHNSGMLHRLITADDGRLYGLFTSAVLTAEPNTTEHPYSQAVSLYQMLPYDPVAKVQVLLDDEQGPEEMIRNLPFLVNKGYVYYVEYEDVPFHGYVHTLKMRNMASGETFTLLDEQDPESMLLRIQNWQISNDTLYFSAHNLANTSSLLGEIDTLAIRDGADDAIRVIEMQSARGAFLEVRDTETLRPAQPLLDTGSAPIARFHAQPENPASVSIDFSKYMNKSSVMNNLRFTEQSGAEVDYVPVWMYQTLHLIADTSAQGTYDQVAGPMQAEKTYTLSLQEGVRDAWDWDLAGDANEVEVTIHPQDGWIVRQHVDQESEVSGVSEGGYALFLGRRVNDEYVDARYEVLDDNGASLQLPTHFSVQFSARKLWWGGVNLTVVGDDDFELFSFMVDEQGMKLGYRDAPDNDNYQVGWVDDGSLFSGQWRSYRFNVFAQHGTLEVSDNGTDFTQLETQRWVNDGEQDLPIDNIMPRQDDEGYRLVWKKTNRATIDKLIINELDEDGAVVREIYSQGFNDIDTVRLNEIFIEFDPSANASNHNE